MPTMNSSMYSSNVYEIKTEILKIKTKFTIETDKTFVINTGAKS